MQALRRFVTRFVNLFARRRQESEFDAELDAHLGLMQDELQRRGMTPEEARRVARVKLGGVEQARELHREARTLCWFETLWRDFHFALRMFRKNPGFTVVAILTLALGVGATTAIFSAVDAVILKPLPFATADRLVRVQSVLAATGDGDVASYPDFVDWRSQNDVFEGMAAFETKDFALAGRNVPAELHGAVVSAQLFSLLRATPALGRTFLSTEDEPGAANGTAPVILSDGLWQRQFGSDPSVMGATIQLSGKPFTVVGVMPPGFEFPITGEGIDLWTTIAVEAAGGANAMTAQRGAHFLDVVAVLKPGVKLTHAQAEMAAIANSLNRQHPENKPRSASVIPEAELRGGPVRTPLLVLLGAVVFVLLIVCVNVASLLLARATSRHKEFAVRVALGASRGRAIRQLLLESTVLGLVGGALGSAAAMGSLKLIAGFVPGDVLQLDGIGIDFRVLLFAALTSLVTGILFGLAPALRVSRIDLTDVLSEAGRGAGTQTKAKHRLSGILVSCEVTLALVLLLGAALLLRSFLYLTRVNPGFDPHHILTFQIDLANSGPKGPPTKAFLSEALSRLSALPGVISASATASLPLTGDNIVGSFEIDGKPEPSGSRPMADFNAVEPDYFKTLGISLIQGRGFTKQDDDLKSPPVVIVNRTFAQRFLGGESPIGKRIRPGINNGYPPGPGPFREIVGVIGDVKQSELGADAAPEIYAPFAQSPFGTMAIVMCSASDPNQLVEAARSRIASLSSETPIYRVETLDEYSAQSFAVPQFITLLLGAFAVFALLLACLGIYGMISYFAAQRTREIGIRMALGAQRVDVMRMVLRQGVRPALIGIVFGIVISLKLTTVISSLLYGVKPTDPLAFVAVSAILCSVALVACWIPARRAMRVDPMIALRHE